MIERLEAMLTGGQDNALLRYSLGGAYLKQGDALRAETHLRAALAHDPEYSAAWRSLGQALVAAQQPAAAAEAYEQGIVVAERRGDKQAAKEMRVFLRRLSKTN